MGPQPRRPSFSTRRQVEAAYLASRGPADRALAAARTGVAIWSDARARLAESPEPLLGELFLDAPLLAADAESLLEQLWPQLIADHGSLLNRALNRFWSVASIADPRHEELTAGLPQLATHLAATARLPLQSLWPGVLCVLARHADEAASLAPGRVADLVNLWLRSEHPVGMGDRDAGSPGIPAVEADGRDRTGDLIFTRDALYQLSYVGLPSYPTGAASEIARKPLRRALVAGLRAFRICRVCMLTV